MKCILLIFANCIVYSFAYENKNIFQWLNDTVGYSILEGLIKQAGLTTNLSTGGPFTLFAPTDAAFAKVPSNTLAALTAHPTQLADVLQGHMVRGYVLGPQIVDGLTGTALNSAKLTYGNTPLGGRTVDGANILSADNILNNGVVHGIDTVILPYVQVNETIPEVLLKQDGRFANLDVLLAITEFKGVLSSGNLTFFAPIDSAFVSVNDRLPSFEKGNAVHQYTEILKAHVVSGVRASSSLKNGDLLLTLHGSNIHVTVGSHLGVGLKVNGANVIGSDIRAVDGVVHVIDKVIIPNDI